MEQKLKDENTWFDGLNALVQFYLNSEMGKRFCLGGGKTIWLVFIGNCLLWFIGLALELNFRKCVISSLALL